MQTRRALALAAALAPGALSSGLSFALPAAHAADVDCYATDAVSANRWADAEAELRRALTAPSCSADRNGIRYSLAHAIERQADATPARACDAERLYRQITTSGADPALADPARDAADRMARACLASKPAVAPPPVVERDPAVDPDPAPAPSRTAAWLTTGGAVLAAGAGGVLLWLGVQHDNDRQTAEADLRAAHAAGNADAFAAATDRFETAADAATAFGLAGWGSLAVAAGLGATATWLWLDDNAAITVAPGAVGVSARF